MTIRAQDYQASAFSRDRYCAIPDVAASASTPIDAAADRRTRGTRKRQVDPAPEAGLLLDGRLNSVFRQKVLVANPARLDGV